MSVELDPPELGFRRPFQQEVSQNLRLKNPHNDPVAFKVKTTAPKQYCVRPNSGRIEPGEVVEVQILLQAMKEDPPLDTKCKDKFLVQSVLVTADKEFNNVSALWTNIEQTAKSSIQEKKIRVLFLPADNSTTLASAETGTSRSAHSELRSSPSIEAVTPQRGTSDGAASRVDERPSGAKSLGEIRQTPSNPATSGGVAATVSAAAASVAKAIPTSSEDVKAELERAKAQILKLQQQIETSTGLRQRKADTSSTSKTSPSVAIGAQSAPAGGVSVQITALLCLLSFLIAYFLF